MQCRFVPLLFLIPLFAVAVHAQITATLITSDGAPLPGVRASAYAVESSAEALSRLTSATPNRKVLAFTISDSAGRFELTVKEHGVLNVMLEKQGFAPESMVAESKSDQGAILLRAARATTSTVRYRGKPLPDASVVLWNAGTEVVTRTDPEGKFRVADPSVWRPSVMIYMKGIPVTIVRNRPDSQLPSGFDVASPTLLRGSVLNADDSPAPDAAIRIDGIEYGKSNADGSFSISSAPPKWVEVRALLGAQVAIVRTGSAALTLKLAPSLVLKGRVRDEAGRGLGGAIITLRNRSDADGESIIISDSRGNFVAPALPRGVYKFVVRRPGFSGASGAVTLVGPPVHRDVTLAPAAIAIGSVRDDNREPVAGAVVRVRDRSSLPGAQPLEAYTAPDGRFILHGIEGGTRVRLIGQRRGFPEGESDRLDFKSGEIKRGILLTVPSGFAVSGRVIDAAGKPLSGVTIEYSDSESSSAPPSVDLPKTADDGRFQIRVPRGKYFFSFRAAGFAPRIVEGPKVDADVKLGSVVLDPGTTLAGRVMRSGGAAAEDVSVTISQDRRVEVVRSAADGSFEVADLLKAPLRVNASARDGGTAVKDLDGPVPDLILQLPDSVIVRGRVIDAESKRPLPDFEAGVGKAPFSSQKTSIHSDDGTFAIPVARADGLQLVASAAGYSEARVDVDLRWSEEPDPLDISLHPALALTGKVTGPDGEPLPAVAVLVLRRVEAGRGGTYVSLKDSFFTDAAGEYSADNIDTGLMMLQFVKEGFLKETKSLEVAGRALRVDAQLSRGTRLNGVVRDESGASVPDALVRAMPSGGGPAISAKSDNGGRFTLEPIAAARHSVKATAAGYADETLRDVDVAATPELRVVLKRGGTVRGRLRGLELSDFPFVTIMVGQRDYEREVTPAGTFTLVDVAEGSTTIGASLKRAGARRTSEVRPLEVVAGSEASIEIEFRAGNRVSGTVRRRSDALANATVEFTPVDGRQEGRVSARTSHSGFYEADGLFDGRYTVRVQEAQSRPVLTSSFTTAYDVKGSGTFDIDLKQNRISGRVLDSETREPLAGASATLTPADQTISPVTSAFVLSDSEGRFVLPDAESGASRLIVRKRGYVQGTRDLDVGAQVIDAVEISLRKSKGTMLRVTDSRDGRKLDPIVTAFDSQGRAVLSEMILSSPEGVARLDLSEGDYELDVRANQYATRFMRVSLPTDELRIALTPGGALRVRAGSAQKSRITLRNALGFFVRDEYSAQPSFVIEGSRTIPALSPGIYTATFGSIGTGDVKRREVTIIEGQTAELSID